MVATNLEGASLGSTHFRDADLSYANLSNVDLYSSALSYADLSNTSLIGANLNQASFSSANLSGANLSNTSYWIFANFTDAIYSESTIFPSSFNPAAEGMVFVSEVPLPAGIYLFLSGLVGLGLMRGRNA